MIRNKGIKNLKILQGRLQAIILLAALAASFVPNIFFHQHKTAEVLQCKADKVEFLSLLDHKEEPCDTHNSHFSNPSTFCEQCDFIFNTNFLLSASVDANPILQNRNQHSFLNTSDYLENAPSILYNKGSPIC